VIDVTNAFRELVIETPSRGYDGVGDAAEVHRLTGTAGAVTLQLPGVEEPEYLREQIERRGLRVGTVRRALAQPDCDVGAAAVVPWPLEGTAFPGQDDLRERRRRLVQALGSEYARLRPGQELLLAPCADPELYASDLPDWGSALLICLKLGDRARVLVQPGPHVVVLADEGRLGGLYFEGRVHPFETFLVFAELGALPRLLLGATFDVEATTLAVVDLQEAYAKALHVDREALREAQEFGDALYGYGLLLDAFKTDVREVCAAARVALGAAEDPIVALRQSGYIEVAR
jgi:L-rhamnose isomerase / sugar isomerase